MKQQANYEILLFTGTSLTNREFCDKPGQSNSGKRSSLESLEKACRNGSFSEFLHELANDPETFIGQIRPATHFLRINMGAIPTSPDYETTLDPYLFLTITRTN